MIITIKMVSAVVQPRIIQIAPNQNILQKTFSVVKQVAGFTKQANGVLERYINGFEIDTREPNILESFHITKYLNSQSKLDMTFTNINDNTIRSLTNGHYKVTLSVKNEKGVDQILFTGDLVEASANGDIDKKIQVSFRSATYGLLRPVVYANLMPLKLLQVVANNAGLDCHVLADSKSKDFNTNNLFSDNQNQQILTGLDIIQRICQEYDLNWYIDCDSLVLFDKRKQARIVPQQSVYYEDFKLGSFYSYDGAPTCSLRIPKIYTSLKVGDVIKINNIKNPVYQNINKMTSIDLPFKVVAVNHVYDNSSGYISTNISTQDAMTI